MPQVELSTIKKTLHTTTQRERGVNGQKNQLHYSKKNKSHKKKLETINFTSRRRKYKEEEPVRC